MNGRLRRASTALLAPAVLLTASLTGVATTTAAWAGEPEWTRQFGTRGNDYAYAVAAGPDARVHVVGRTEGALGGARKGFDDPFIITFDEDGNELWHRQPGTAGIDEATAVATDAEGNVYVAGNTQGDALVIKFDRDGRILWKRKPGTSTAYDGATGVATDTDGNVYVAGLTYGSLGGSYKGDADVFVIKFGPDGRIVWKRQPSTVEADNASGVATDTDGNVYVVGRTGAFYDSSDAFVIKLDRDGIQQWRRRPGTAQGDLASSVATDADGNVYVAGSTNGALGGPNKGYWDPFVLKFDRDGRIVWKRQPGSHQDDYAAAIAVDADGNAFLAGETTGSVGGPFQGGKDIFVMEFDRNGVAVWKNQPSTPLWDQAAGVATDTNGSVYLVGYVHGSSAGDTTFGKNDGFLMKFGPGTQE